MTDIANIVMTMPVKDGDATEYTYRWAIEMEKVGRNLGYNVISIKSNNVTYDNVNKALEKYRPKVYIHTGHGCPTALNGQKECIVTRKYEIEELMRMDSSELDKIMSPVKISGCTNGICGLHDDICLPLCFKETNLHLLKDTIVVANACHSSSHLGRDVISYGAKSYMGYSDLLLFPVDTMKSQDMFGEIHTEFVKNILMGNSVGESYYKMMKMEDTYIRMYKSVKWVGLPLLFNHKHRELLGDHNATIYY